MQAGCPTTFFFNSPSAKMEKLASSIWKHFYTARFSDEGGVGRWKHDLQLCVRRNTDFWVRLIRPCSLWQKLSPEKNFSLHFTPTSPFVKINAFWFCLTFVRIQDPEIPRLFFLRECWCSLVGSGFCWLLLNRAPAASWELSSSSAAPFVTTLRVFFLSELNYKVCKYCLNRWYLYI